MSLTERFETLQELGVGAFGRVYLARERHNQHLLALKIAHPGSHLLVSARMRREYRALSKLNHQNIVRVYEFGEDQQQAFLTLEYINGLTLEAWLHAGQVLSSIVENFSQLSQAIEVVHDAGLLHRDLKPENVMLNSSGTIKLMDFGLSKLNDSSLQLTKVGTMLGTVLYMSPEQCRGDTLDARADWYSFGIMLYRAVCGQLPFTGNSLPEVVMAHLQRTPKKPSLLNPSIPVVLEELLLRLLAKNPAERPNHANEIRQALQQSLEQPQHSVVTKPHTPRADQILVVPLLGRSNELVALEAAVSQNGVTAVRGIAGIGKTHLLQSFAQNAKKTCIWSAATADDQTPFGMVSRLVSSLANEDLLTSAPVALRQLWKRFAPRANLGLDATTSAVLSNDPALAQLELLEGFRNLLEIVADQTIIILENIHWADQASLELLRYACAQIPNTNIILSYRSEELSNAAKVLPEIRHNINLEPLPQTIMQDILEGWLGAKIEAALIDELLIPASGNPWLLSQRVETMLEHKLLTQRAGVYEWTRSSVHLPIGVQDLMQQRIAHLGQTTLEFARAASIFGQHFFYEDVKTVLDWTDDACLNEIEILLRTRLILEQKNDAFTFTHPAYPEALHGDILGLKLRRWHRRAAAILEQRPDQLITLARHHLAGGNAEAALSVALSSAEQFANQFAFPQAEMAYRIALEALEFNSLDSTALRATIQSGLGKTLYATGHVDEAIALWRRALTVPALYPELSAEIKVQLAAALSAQGEGSQALVVLQGLQSAKALLEKTSCLQRLGENKAGIQTGLAALRLGKTAGDLAVQSQALSLLAWLMHNQQRFTRGQQLANLAIKFSENHPYQRMLAYRALSSNLYDLAKYNEVEVVYRTALTMPITTAQIQHQAWFSFGMANILLIKEDFAQAELQYQAAYHSSIRAGSEYLQQDVLLALVYVAHVQNQLETARKWFALLPNDSVKAIWQCRLDLCESDVAMLPERQSIPTWAEPLYPVAELEWLLAHKQYARVLALCKTPQTQFQWFWALAELHASWRLGLQTHSLGQQLQQDFADAGISKNLSQTLAPLVTQAIAEKGLSKALESWRHSVIGIFARDVTNT